MVGLSRSKYDGISERLSPPWLNNNMIPPIQLLKLIISLWIILSFWSCEPEHNYDVLTSARVTLVAPDSMALLQVKGTMSLQSLTNKFTWTEARWDSISVVFPKVLRGPYNITADGKVAVSIKGGRRKVYRFRAANSYVELLNQPSEVKLDIQLFK